MDKHTVTAVSRHVDPIVEHLKLADGSVETTPNHRFYTTEHGWIAAGSLRAGDHILKQSRSTATVLGFTLSFSPTPMYDLTVAGVHDFYVGGAQWLAHNCPIDGPGSGPGYKVRVGGGKAASTDIPSWARELGFPKVTENGRAFATRLMNARYGAGNWSEKSAEFSQLKKYGDRGFTIP